MFVAFWNDFAAVRKAHRVGADAPPIPAPLASPPTPSIQAAWLFAAFSCFVLTLAASFGAATYARRSP